MTFTFTNYAAIPPQDSPFKDILGKVLSGYNQTTQAKYLPQILAESLKKAQLANKYYAPNMESQLGLRGAQTDQARAHTGLLGEQTRGMRLENQYSPQKMQSQIEESQARAQKARYLQKALETIFSGGQFNGANQEGQLDAENSNNQQQISRQLKPTHGMDYAQAATAMQALGLGKPQVVDANGKYMAITPFGNIDTGIQGLSEKEKELTKQDAKKIGALEDVVLNNQNKLDTFNELNNLLGSPEFEAIRQLPAAGGLENWMRGKFGTKEQQNLIGRANTLMGNIIKDSARDFGGQFRVGEQALLNGMKPNPSDSLEVMKGKAEALTYMTQMMTKRAELEASLMRDNGKSPLAAKMAADALIESKSIKQEIRDILHPASAGKPTPEQARAELERRRTGRK